MRCINFYDLQVTPLLHKLITQTIVKYDDNTKDFHKGEIVPITFEDELFKNYKVKIEKVKRTGINKLSNSDIVKNGFLYKPHFLKFYEDKGISEEDTILQIDFVLLEEEN